MLVFREESSWASGAGFLDNVERSWCEVKVNIGLFGPLSSELSDSKDTSETIDR